MPSLSPQKKDLLSYIDLLLKEAYSLPKTRESWPRREEIDWEIMKLCRKMGDLSDGPLPYWIDDKLNCNAPAHGAF